MILFSTVQCDLYSGRPEDLNLNSVDLPSRQPALPTTPPTHSVGLPSMQPALPTTPHTTPFSLAFGESPCSCLGVILNNVSDGKQTHIIGTYVDHYTNS